MQMMYDTVYQIALMTKEVFSYIQSFLQLFIDYPLQFSIAIILGVVTLYALGSLYRRIRVVERKITYRRGTKKRYTTDTRMKKTEGINRRRNEVGRLALLLSYIRDIDSEKFDDIFRRLGDEQSYVYYRSRIEELNASELLLVEETLHKILRHYSDKPIIAENYETILMEVKDRYGINSTVVVESEATSN